MLELRGHTHLAVAVALGCLASCSDGTPSDSDLVDVEFGIQRTGGSSASILGDVLTSANGEAFAIAPDTVASLSLNVESIQVLPLLNQDAEEDDGSWITVELAQPVPIDLVALPTTGESPLVLATGSLPAGGYTNVRLFISDAVIVFKGPLSLGAAITFEGNIEHVVTVPSAEQTGIKTDMSFNALEGSDVTLVFDETASFGNVTLTGNGQVILAPVIRSPGNGGA